ncbi:hemerythrin domain-containing protein [Alcaligenaceae bacterium CGII-47]|nr:hemerythrin domain-containing protein [Alcaligenaceae bacterium CGII-47]
MNPLSDPITPPAMPALHEAPLREIASKHQDSRAQCMALQALIKHIAIWGADSDAQSKAEDILHHFDVPARECQEVEAQHLFPAIIESMAGSDAVCLRGMTEGLSNMLHALQRRWNAQLRPRLLRIANGESIELSAADVQAFCDEYSAYAECADTELLPMAERLLTDAQIELLDQAMQQHRYSRDSGRLP